MISQGIGVDKNIRVKCIEGFTLHQNNEEETLLAVAEEGRIYDAALNLISDEYFAKDNEGREFLVGELNWGEDLILSDDFELVSEG